MVKSNPEMSVEIPEQIFLVQNFTLDLTAQRPDFCICYRLGDTREIKREKLGNHKLAPLH